MFAPEHPKDGKLFLDPLLPARVSACHAHSDPSQYMFIYSCRAETNATSNSESKLHVKIRTQQGAKELLCEEDSSF